MIWKVAVCAVAFTTPLFGHFMFEFLSLKKRAALFMEYSGAVISSLLIFLNIEFLSPLRFNSIYFPYSIDLRLKLVFFIWILTGIYNLNILYRVGLKSPEKQRRNQAAYIFYTVLLAFIAGPPNFLTGFGLDIYPYLNILVPLYAAIIAYAILTQHLMDINIAIKKGLVYSALAAMITAGYLILVISIGKLFQGLVGYQSFIINLLAIFAIAILFNPLKDWIQHLLDKLFFKGTLESLSQERERMKEKLFHAEKLAYVGRLASSVVHEIRNPLTAIKTFVEYFPEKVNDPEYKDKFQRLVPKEIDRIDNVVNQLLDLAKPKQPKFQSVNITSAIDATLALLEESLRLKKINVKREYASNEVMVQGDEEQLRQVFLNLFLNSIQAMNENGTLEVAVNLSSPNMKSVVICIKDDGCGISEEDLKNIFTPFFTTKEDGIGLGLIITQEIIKSHKGKISVQSKKNEGVKFIIELSIEG
ncbi:nitrogen regulation protein NR(II) [Candidatus Omnitrophota bacterium]